jgi:hypothetical protein
LLFCCIYHVFIMNKLLFYTIYIRKWNNEEYSIYIWFEGTLPMHSMTQKVSVHMQRFDWFHKWFFCFVFVLNIHELLIENNMPEEQPYSKH